MISFFRKGFPFIVATLVLVAIIVSYGEAFANKYDDEEAIRRAAERLVEIDRQQKEAAQQRYDEAHKDKYSSGNPTLTVVVFIIVIIAIMLFKKK